MRHVASIVCASLALVLPVSAQTPSVSHQSARQALIEMFLGQGPDDFARHLPDAARRAIVRPSENPDTSMVMKFSTIGRQMVAGGQHVETFDAGPNILVTEQPGSHERIEVAVEHDSLIGEEDEIELSLHVYKDGQLKTLPVVPKFVFTMKQEKEVWRLQELMVAGRVPLTDPDYLKELRREQDEANESAAQMRMSVIAAAEAQYAEAHPDRGHVCSLTELFAGQQSSEGDSGDASPPPPPLFDPGQSNNEYSGYRFTLKGCEGNPAAKYQASATPIDADSSGKSFCADESGIVKSIAGSSSHCFSRGKAVNNGIVFNGQE